MDVAARQFDEDFFAFKVLIKELERRLGAIIVQVGGGQGAQGAQGAQGGQAGLMGSADGPSPASTWACPARAGELWAALAAPGSWPSAARC
jgi:hypothetical protein